MNIRLLLLLVVCLVSALVWGLRDDEPDFAPDTQQTSSSGRAEHTLAPTQPTTEAADNPTANDPATETQRTEVTATNSEALRVRVVDRQNQPVAGVRIEVRGKDETLQLSETNADGWAHATRMPYTEVRLHAKHNGMSGSAHWAWRQPLAREVILRLYRDRIADIVVKDDNGQPIVGAEAAVQRATGHRFKDRPFTARTDERGRARVTIPGDHYLARNQEVLAEVEFGDRTSDSDAVTWSKDGPTSFKVTFVSKPADSATLIVQFLDEAGLPFAPNGTAYLQQLWQQGPVRSTGVIAERKVEGTSIEFDVADPSNDLAVELREVGRVTATLDVKMPARTGRHVVTLRRGESAPHIAIPLRDEQGNPITDGSYEIFGLIENSMWPLEAALEPDANGLLHLYLDKPCAGRIEVASKFREDALHATSIEKLQRPYNTTFGGPAPTNPVLGTFAFPHLAAGNTYRAKPIAFAPLEPRIVGVVVDENDQPAPGVKIYLATHLPEPEAFVRYSTTSDASGRFEVLASELPDEVFVCGRRPLGYCEPRKVEPSREPIRLVLRPTGSLEVNARLAAHLTQQQLNKTAGPRGGSVILQRSRKRLQDGWWAHFRSDWGWNARVDDKPWQQASWLSTDKPVVFRDLLPGTYTMLFRIGHNTLGQRTEVVIRSGETTRPKGFLGQEIGADLEVSYVRVLDSDGKPITARVRFRLPEWQESYPNGTNQQTDENGEAWFLVPRSARPNVTAVAQNKAPRTKYAARFPVEITMTSGAAFEVSVGNLAKVKDRIHKLYFVATRRDDPKATTPILRMRSFSQVRHPSSLVDERGHATIGNLEPGDYRLWLATHPSWKFVQVGDRTVFGTEPTRIEVDYTLTEADIAELTK